MLHSKNVRRGIKTILFIIIFILIMTLFDAAFELDEGVTESMLTAYSNQSGIDTVFVGNSAGEMLDADLYSELTGDKAFNMCTPSQGLSVSFKNIKLASSQHKIGKVILLMTFDTANSEKYDAIDHVYDRVVNSSSPFHVRVINTVKKDFEQSFSYNDVNTEHSVNIWIPWENETLHGFSNVGNNLNRRFQRFIKGDRLGSHIAYDLNTIVYDRAPGYLDKNDTKLLQQDIGNISDLPIPPNMLSSDKLTLLARICSYCRDNNIDFTVIVTPHRSDYYDRFASFRTDSTYMSEYLNDFISKRGFIYYNTEDDPKLHTILPDKYFYDWEHVSGKYVVQATEYLTDVIRRLK